MMEIRKIEFQQGIEEYIPLRSKLEYEFHYIVGGKGRLRGDLASYPVRGGSFFLLRPEERFRLLMDRRHGLNSRYVIRAELMPPQHQDMSKEIKSFLQQIRIVDIGTDKRNFFEQLRSRLGSGNPALAEAAKHQFLSFILDLSANSQLRGDGGDREYIEESLRYMQEQIRRKLTLEDIGRQVNLNTSYFIRLFRRRLGTAPMKYFMELKINAACNLLDNTEMSIADIAGYLGFSEEFYFSRTFKKFKGLPPSHYRRKIS